jgi:hypothetical protein
MGGIRKIAEDGITEKERETPQAMSHITLLMIGSSIDW